MSSSTPADLPVHRFTGRDGAELAYRELGDGRPVVLIHGFFSTAYVNWIRYGHAAALAERGFRVVMPDLRGHGDSAHPHDPAAYPADVLADDGFALLDHLGLDDYDLGGYSLGGRTAVRMLARGARPRRAIVAGMGYDGIVDTGSRGGHFRYILENLGTFERGTPQWRAQAFLETVGADPVAMLHVLDTFVDTTPGELARIEVPTLVISGVDDVDNGSSAELAGALPDARFTEIPGDHMGAVTKRELGAAMAEFLEAPELEAP